MDPNMDIMRPITCGESCHIEPMVASARKELCRSDREGYGVGSFARAQGSEHPALSEVGVKMKRLIHKTVGWTGFCSPTTGFMLQAARKSDVRLRPVTTGDRLQGRRTVRTSWPPSEENGTIARLGFARPKPSETNCVPILQRHSTRLSIGAHSPNTVSAG